MQIQSRAQRNAWQRVLLGLIPDVLIGVVVGLVNGNLIVGTIGTVLLLQLLYLLLWLKQSIWAWSYFKLSDRRFMASAVSDSLRSNKYPEPGDSIESAEAYFQAVAADEKQPLSLRMHAHSESAILRLLPALVGPQAAWRTSIAYEDAIERHKAAFPVDTASDARRA